MDTFDYVIVGAGSAGCVLANRLSADPGVRVCVLEAGPRDWHPYIHIPAGFIKLFHQPGLNWLYTMEPGEWTGGRRLLAPRRQAGGAFSRRAARRSAVPRRLTGTSTIAGSGSTMTAGHSVATATGAMRTSC